MQKRVLIGAMIGIVVMFGGCSKKHPTPTAMPGGGMNTHMEDTSRVSTTGGSVTTDEVSGGVTSNGKYTGSDGVSSSGIKMIYFASDRYNIDADQINRLMNDLPKIKKLVQSSGTIRVEGNCDEFGTDQYNYALGLKRAKSVKDVLTRNGIPSSAIKIVSYGESNPVCTGTSAACHAKNRRVEINGI